MIQSKRMREALTNAIGGLRKSKARGMEGIIQKEIERVLPGFKHEHSLEKIGATRVDNGTRGRLDVLWGGHAIEIKVVRMPRLGANPNRALYDIGQISADHWRLSNARKITSAEIIVLLYGPLVEDLRAPIAVYREFHNRMFVDYQNSMEYGELKREKGEMGRRRQLKSIREMGFDRPCGTKKASAAVVVGEFALVSIMVGR